MNWNWLFGRALDVVNSKQLIGRIDVRFVSGRIDEYSVCVCVYVWG